MSALTRIFANKAEEVSAARAALSLVDLRAIAADAPAPRPFRKALEDSKHPVSLIAEVKKASPSKGVIRPTFNPAAIAEAYRDAGAECLSVLTDEVYFHGSKENLQKARAASGLPCLRKDFLFDPYQVYESRAWGADAILLIVAALEPGVIEELSDLAAELGMDALVEVHNSAEADVALRVGAKFIGVNNRDLSNFQTTLSISEELLPELSKHAVTVSESALETKGDVDRVQAAGARSVLIGTTFCAALEVEEKVREVMGW